MNPANNQYQYFAGGGSGGGYDGTSTGLGGVGGRVNGEVPGDSSSSIPEARYGQAGTGGGGGGPSWSEGCEAWSLVVADLVSL